MGERMTVSELQIMDERRVVDVSVEVHDVQWLTESSHDRVGHSMIAAEHNRESTAGKDLARHLRRIVERSPNLGRPHIDITGIDDQALAEFFLQVLTAGLGIVDAALCTEPEGMFTNRSWSHPGTGKKRRSFIVRYTENGNICIQLIQVRADL